MADASTGRESARDGCVPRTATCCSQPPEAAPPGDFLASRKAIHLALAKPPRLWRSNATMSLKLSTWLASLSLALACVLAASSGTPALAQRAPAEAAPGVSWIDIAEIPPEARETLALIKAGGPFPYDKDGTKFGNREKLLPQRPADYYSEYTVKTPGERTRGARRIVAGGDPRTSGEYYYTDDHYKSFRRIREAPRGRQGP